MRNNGRKREPGNALSAVEREVVELVAEGEVDKTIGRTLGSSYLTVRDHVNSAKRKLGAKTRAHLVSLWMKSKLW